MLSNTVHASCWSRTPRSSGLPQYLQPTSAWRNFTPNSPLRPENGHPLEAPWSKRGCALCDSAATRAPALRRRFHAWNRTGINYQYRYRYSYMY